MATFRSVFSSVFGGGDISTPEDTMAGAFDGITWPLIRVYAAFGGSFAPAADVLRLGVGPGLGTGKLGGGSGWVDITADVQVIRRDVGRDSPIDQARVGTCVLTVDNRSGDYDPSNPAGPFWSENLLTDNQESLEDGTTTGWAVGGSCTIASTTAQAQSGSRCLALTSTASSGGIWANTTTGAGGQRVTPGDPVKVSAWFRSATRSVSGIVAIMFWGPDGAFISQVNAPGVATTTSGWVQGSTTTVTPTGAAYASAQVLYASVIAVGEVHYADTVLIQASGVDIGTPVQVLAEYPVGTVFPRFYGEIADIAPDDGYDPRVLITCADGLEKLGRARLAATPFAPAFDGDTSGERVGHLADAAGWPSSLRALDTGYAILGPTTLGASALELMRKVEATEVGLLFVDGAGVLVFYDRHRTTTAARSITVQAAFTDTGGASDVEMISLGRAKSRERVVNDWHITRESGYIEIDIDGNPTDTDNPQEQVATDQVSVDKYGLLSGGQGLGPLLRFDEEALAMAQGLLPLHKTPQVRIREVTVDAITQGRWAQLLPLTLLDRISVSRDYGPAAVAGQLLVQALVEEIRNDEQNAGWTFTFSTTNPLAAPDLFVLGTAQLGVDGLGW